MTRKDEKKFSSYESFIIKTRQAKDDSIHTYRQITDRELIRATSLIIADVLYKTSIPNRKKYMINGSSGSFTLACDTGVKSANKVQWYFTNFKNEFSNGASSLFTNKIDSYLTLSSNTSTFNDDGIYGETLYYLPSLTIDITSDIELDSYKNKITFSAGNPIEVNFLGILTNTTGKFNLSITTSTGAGVSNPDTESTLVNWFPYDMGHKHEVPDSNINPSLKTYQYPWWN